MRGSPEAPHFQERPTEAIVSDALRFGGPLLVASAACGVLGWSMFAAVLLGLSIFVASFFRNPQRFIPGDDSAVVAPADGRVIEVGEIEGSDGEKWLRVGIFLSVFNVHVNRAPVAGRVLSVERSGSKMLAAFNRDAESLNVRCDMTLEMEGGTRVRVAQITGLIARRIICHPQVGEWIGRGERYGLIRFGSRTDVWLPLDAELRVMSGDRVRGGSSVLALLPETAAQETAA
jgi:phosphatidylserine decarboxylase